MDEPKRMTTDHRVYVKGRAGRYGGLAVKCTCGDVLAYDKGPMSGIDQIELATLKELEAAHLGVPA